MICYGVLDLATAILTTVGLSKAFPSRKHHDAFISKLLNGILLIQERIDFNLVDGERQLP
jgi:hypothetical protein